MSEDRDERDGDSTLVGARFRLEELLGSGGSAAVYRAVDVRSGAEVAVKVLHPHLCADAAARDAFLREAERVRVVTHPRIVAVHDAGLHDAGGVVQPWIAMDLVQGPTLREHVERVGPLAPVEAVAVLVGLLDGLEAAHRAGVVHRDISPQNIVLSGSDGPLRPDAVRILDFGLADATGRRTTGADILLADRGSGSVVGNAAYMSPEQAQGLPVRSVSDLYQAAAVLYFALTGAPPFPRATTEQAMRAHVAAPPPVPSVLAPAARSLDRIVTKAMAKTPAHRFRDAGELRAALTSAVPTPAASALPGAESEPEAETAAIAEATADRTGATRVLARTPLDGELSYLSAASAASAASPVGSAGGDAHSGRARRRSASGAIAAAAVVTVAVLGAWVAAASDPRTAGAAQAPRPSVSTPPPSLPTPTGTPDHVPAAPSPPPEETQEEPPPEPELIDVPLLHGTLADAEAALRDAGLVLGAVLRTDGAEPADRVVRQDPAAGVRIERGSAVGITVTSGSNSVPSVVGHSLGTARALVESAGFSVQVTPVADPAAAVVAVEPVVGTVLRVGVTVTLVVRPPTEPEPPAGPPPATPTPTPTGQSP
ncbi:serine/threonine protein kinase [Microbacterium album]|uniref:serine/threonine protein kinase n=1 Tax=Microbacterium album TaxID=2053191 RepID=UPI00166599D1|nr:serine/threonine-protein kinase [Microbacterium album]